MPAQKSFVNIQIPRLDAFDILSILLWVGILVPAVQLPASATFTFARSIFFILWVAGFLAYVGYRIFKEKRTIFYSRGKANLVMAGIAVVFILSFLLSAARIDSLFGFDLSFSSSFLVLMSLVVIFYALKLAGLSLEFAVSRVLAVLPFTLVLLDIASVFCFLVPSSVYQTVLGSYSQYFSFLRTAPTALLGVAQQLFFIHVIAVVVAGWQIATVYKKGEKLTPDLYRRAIVAIALAFMTSYLFFITWAPSLASIIIVPVVLAVVTLLVLSNKTKQVQVFGIILGSIVIISAVLGMFWVKSGAVGLAQAPAIANSVTTGIIQKSFLNSTTPMWRQLTGFGVSTFPYLFLQYRSLDSAKIYGNNTFFFKPSSFATELFIEHGLLGLIAFAALAYITIVSFVRASSKTSLLPEMIILVILAGILLTTPSSLPVLVMLFVTLAAFFDKTESLPESLHDIRAVDLQETTYSNKSVSRSGRILLIGSVTYLVIMVIVSISPVLAMTGYARVSQRYLAAQQQVANKDAKALQTYTAVFTLANKYQGYCKNCAQFAYLSLSTLQGASNLYSGLTSEQRLASQELRQVRNMMLQSVTGLLSKNSVRYNYWLTVSQVYRTIADDEQSTSLYTLAVQSIKNALAVNPYSIDANYLYVDVLLRLGNDTQINSEIRTKLATLNELARDTYQVRFIEGILLAREKKYTDAISAFEQTKKDSSESKSLTTAEKKQISDLADKRITDVKAIQTGTIVPTPTVTPKTSH